MQRKDEDKADWKERTKDVKYPVVEKLFREYGPKFKKRNEGKKCAGGYTRIYKLGPPSRRRCRDVRDRDHLIQGRATGPPETAGPF